MTKKEIYLKLERFENSEFSTCYSPYCGNQPKTKNLNKIINDLYEEVKEEL